ncbi:MAG: phosphate ABC transporter permease PstA [Halomonadaceae bacterium]|nr:MAG: phosphate ABC transporter permease PstA [Halomonadaceae bacterium]
MKNWIKSGSPWIWLNGGAVAICMIMVVGLIGLIAVRGLAHFWPADIVEFTVTNERGEEQIVMGEAVRSQIIPAAVAEDSGVILPEDFAEDGIITRHLIKQGNRDFGRDFAWYPDVTMSEWRTPQNAIMLERREWGDFFGFPVEMRVDDEVFRDEEVWPALQASVERTGVLFDDLRRIERFEVGRINQQIEGLRLEQRRLALDDTISEAEMAEHVTRLEIERGILDAEYEVLRLEMEELRAASRRDTLVARMANGQEVTMSVSTIVRATQPNTMGMFAKLGEYVYRFWHFLTGEPREANTEGGIFPAIFGTVTMVLIMSIIVSPFGVLAAIYLREYAKQGPLLKIIRVSVYNLAGVPSIVFGVFGLGFFVYIVGGSLDELFYPEALPSPTFGRPGLIWASLTLALLTLPVVIVSTEEGLARIPSTVRQGSLALGATKSETLWKVVVPLATPAMMTGVILAIARAAGEVAPLMLVGVVKLAPTLPIDGTFPFVHLERSIMHLGFHIFDVGFQSPNVEAARPLVYATALTLVVLIVALNMTAISVRNRLRERYRSESD